MSRIVKGGCLDSGRIDFQAHSRMQEIVAKGGDPWDCHIGFNGSPTPVFKGTIAEGVKAKEETPAQQEKETMQAGESDEESDAEKSFRAGLEKAGRDDLIKSLFPTESQAVKMVECELTPEQKRESIESEMKWKVKRLESFHEIRWVIQSELPELKKVFEKMYSRAKAEIKKLGEDYEKCCAEKKTAKKSLADHLNNVIKGGCGSKKKKDVKKAYGEEYLINNHAEHVHAQANSSADKEVVAYLRRIGIVDTSGSPTHNPPAPRSYAAAKSLYINEDEEDDTAIRQKAFA
jgi:hypothetical protein